MAFYRANYSFFFKTRLTNISVTFWALQPYNDL